MESFVPDTNIWITLGKNYPPDVFTTLWQRVDALIATAGFRCPDVVLEELKRGTDGLPTLLQSKNGLFVPLDAKLAASVATVLKVCPTLVDPDSPKNEADPYVVALAHASGGIVVSTEKRAKSPTGRQKIPDACDLLGVGYLDWFGFLRHVGWTF